MKLTLCTALILAAFSARAETNLYLGAWSEHLITGDKYNEQHDLIAVEHDGWFVGYFKNSYDLETLTVSHKWSWEYKRLEAGVLGGVMHGYTTCIGHDDSSKNVCPLVAPYVTWDAGPVNPALFLVGEALAVSIRIEL